MMNNRPLRRSQRLSTTNKSCCSSTPVSMWLLQRRCWRVC
jgi:hypothetical protein